MSLSLVKKVQVGFSVVLITTLITGVATFLSQQNIEQGMLSVNALNRIKDDSNELIQNVNSANRALLAHAISRDLPNAELQKESFLADLSDITLLTTQFYDAVQVYPELQELASQATSELSKYLDVANEHISLHEKKLSADERIKENIETLGKTFVLFKSDTITIADTAEANGNNIQIQNAMYVQRTGLNIVNLIKAIVQSNDVTVAKFQIDEVMSYYEPIVDKAESLSKVEGAKPLLEPYMALLETNIMLEDGIISSYKKYHQYDAQSAALLVDVQDIMSWLVSSLNQLNGAINTLTENAESGASTSIQQSIQLIVLLGILTFIATVIVVVSLTKGIKKPLAAIKAGLNKLSNSDLTYTIDDSFDSELGEIVADTNDVTLTLREVISSIRGSDDELTALVEESQRMNKDTLVQVQDQQHQTETIAAAVTEMEVAVKSVADHAAESRESIDTVVVLANQNMSATQVNVQFIEDLQSSLRDATDVMNNLSQQSQHIDEILGVIQGISEQTNLLALNAAIEAARAGEHGRGFAVVADEVRGLAIRTQDSASEIGSMIEKLQLNSKLAVELVESNLEKANQSVEQSNASYESLLKMVDELNVTNEKGHSIATAAEQQFTVAQEVACSITNINDVAATIAQNADLSATQSDQVAMLSHQQSVLLSRFKLPS